MSADLASLTLAALADLIAERVVIKLRSSTTSAVPDVYTTNKIGPHFPGKTRSWMKAHIKAMPGARKVERDWIISREAYEAWLTARDLARASAARLAATPRFESRPSLALVSDSDEALRARADRTISAQGYRRSK